MRLVRVLWLGSIAAGLFGQTATWDTSGNGMLNGTYYFRQAVYVLSSTGDGSLSDAITIYGNVTFNGAGAYTMANVTDIDGANQTIKAIAPTGTYAIAASGQGFMVSPLGTGELIYGTVNAQGILDRKSTRLNSSHL